LQSAFLCPPERRYQRHAKDVRDIALEDLSGLGAIIHLAALSNDPLGEMAPNLTEEINCDATIRLATLAKQSGMAASSNSSSQSMYGVSSTDQENLTRTRARKNR